MAAGSGATVAIPEECTKVFTELKTRRKHRFMVLRINIDSFQLEVENVVPMSADVRDLRDKLPASDCRYVVLHNERTLDDGRIKEDLYFITWNPTTARGQSKVLYTHQKKHVLGTMTGMKELHAEELEDIWRVAAPSLVEESDDDWDPDDD